MIQYRVALLSVSQQTLRIDVTIPALADTLMVTLPAWLPGSYKIRDFARNLGEFRVTDEQGNAIEWQKLDKQTWQINADNQSCTLSYTIVANDFSVRGAFINQDYAFMNGTSIFVDIEGAESLPRQVILDSDSVPANWQGYTAMQTDGDPHTFISTTYNELIDHPIYWGRAQVHTFEVQDVAFTFLLSGEQPIDIERMTKDLVPICDHHLSLFPKPSPVTHYLFITLLADTGYGGLEHRDSTVLMYPRYDLPLLGESEPPKDAYIDYLSLCSHEFFHTWHVKRLRPQVLLAPDLSKEVYTDQLWIYEGITSFYDDLAVARAGKMSPEHYLTILGRHLTRLYHTPGKAKQSAAESSFDAWTRFYQQDANSNNHIVSYYTKGGMIALGLDILLRQQSQHKITMDTLMQALWQKYGANELGTPDDAVHQVCAELDMDVEDYLDSVVYGTEDVELEDMLSEIGLSLHVRARENSSDKGGSATEHQNGKDFGALLKKEPMGCKITQLQQDSAAESAGLMIGDCILAVDNWITDESLLMRTINAASVGTTLSLSVARQGQILTLSLPIQPAQQKAVYLQIENQQAYYAWLGISE